MVLKINTMLFIFMILLTNIICAMQSLEVNISYKAILEVNKLQPGDARHIVREQPINKVNIGNNVNDFEGFSIPLNTKKSYNNIILRRTKTNIEIYASKEENFMPDISKLLITLALEKKS